MPPSRSFSSGLSLCSCADRIAHRRGRHRRRRAGEVVWSTCSSNNVVRRDRRPSAQSSAVLPSICSFAQLPTRAPLKGRLDHSTSIRHTQSSARRCQFIYCAPLQFSGLRSHALVGPASTRFRTAWPDLRRSTFYMSMPIAMMVVEYVSSSLLNEQVPGCSACPPAAAAQFYFPDF